MKPGSSHRPARLSPMSNTSRSPGHLRDNSLGMEASPQSAYYSAPPEQPDGSGSLAPCNKCGRTFAMDRIAMHEKICVKVKEGRKVFDSTKMRTQGTENAKYNRRGIRKTDPPKPKSNWKKNHGQHIFRE